MRPSITRTRVASLLAALTLLPVILCGQDPVTESIEIGFARSIESQVLGETRKLLIAVPDGHAESETRYPVIYLLDGDAHFALAAALRGGLRPVTDGDPRHHSQH